MIIDAMQTQMDHGEEVALIKGYIEILGIQLNETRRTALASDLSDLLHAVSSIPPFKNGRWMAWLQGGRDSERSDGSKPDLNAVQLVPEDELKIFESSDYAPHISTPPDSQFLVTLSYHARQSLLPEQTDISHPKWGVRDVESTPTEVRFDLRWKGITG